MTPWKHGPGGRLIAQATAALATAGIENAWLDAEAMLAAASHSTRVELVSGSAEIDDAARERYLACELQGHRYDIGVKYGLLIAQLALALEGGDRDEVLSGLVELLAVRAK